VVFFKTAADVSSHEDSMPRIMISLFISFVYIFYFFFGSLFASSVNYDYLCKLLYNL
jgi:hypothetical protein